MHRIMCVLILVLFIAHASKLGAQTNAPNSLTLEVAVSKAIQNNPELEVLLKNIEANKAIKLQNGLMPNPEFSLEAENIFGTHEYSGLSGSEITAIFSQDILLAGKIRKLEKVAEMDISVSEWEYETKRLEIITEIRKVFTEALGTEKIISKNKDLVKISDRLIGSLKDRVKSGKISHAEVSRAQIISGNLQIEINGLIAQYNASIFKLTILINDPNLSFSELDGELKEEVTLPSYDSLLIKLNNNPNLKRFDSDYKKQKAVIQFEESKAIPNLTVSAGYKRLNEVNANTFLIGASIPLPIFNRNQGSIQEAQIRLDQKTKEYKVIKNSLTLQLSLLYNRFGTLKQNMEKLIAESLPNAEQSFKVITEGNLVGRFTILDVLDAQRTLFEVQNQYFNLLRDINSVVVEIEGLTVEKIN